MRILKFRNYMKGQYKWRYTALFLSLLLSFEHFFCANSKKIKSHFSEFRRKLILGLQVRDLKWPFWVLNCKFWVKIDFILFFRENDLSYSHQFYKTKLFRDQTSKFYIYISLLAKSWNLEVCRAIGTIKTTIVAQNWQFLMKKGHWAFHNHNY